MKSFPQSSFVIFMVILWLANQEIKVWQLSDGALRDHPLLKLQKKR